MAKRAEASERTAETSVEACALPECSKAANAQVHGGAGVFYCSPTHLNVAVARSLLRPRCPVCRRKFDRPERGRPAVYCSQPCKSSRERTLNTAQRELAKDNGSGDPGEQLARAEALYATWRFDAGGVDGWQGQELRERHWGETVPPRLTVPAAEAVSALVGRINRLRGELREQRRRQAQAEARQARDVVDTRLAEARKAREAEEQAWRDDLLSAPTIDTEAS